MINKAIIVGCLGKDPELRYTQSGKAVTALSVATESYYNSEKHTEWHSVVVWGKQAESCNEHLKKGSMVYVEGRMQKREWEAKGKKGTNFEIISQDVKFLTKPPAKEKAQEDFYEDDIPF